MKEIILIFGVFLSTSLIANDEIKAFKSSYKGSKLLWSNGVTVVACDKITFESCGFSLIHRDFEKNLNEILQIKSFFLGLNYKINFNDGSQVKLSFWKPAKFKKFMIEKGFDIK